jgi:hypothetical protein
MTLTVSRFFRNPSESVQILPNASGTRCPNMPPKRPGGRLAKYATQEAAAQAKKERNHYWYKQSCRQTGPADFIPYQPSLYSGIPADTPPGIGLRTSPDIRIPQDRDILPSDTLQNEYPNAAQPLAQSAELDKEMAARAEKIRREEQEPYIEQEAYKLEVAAILARMPTGDDISGSAESTRQNVGEREEGERREVLQRSCSLPDADRIDDVVVGYDYDSIASYTSSCKPASVYKSPNASIVLSPAPTSCVSSAQSRKSSCGQQRALFPTQKNTLLSWAKPLAQGPSTGYDSDMSAQLETPRLSYAATPLPLLLPIASADPPTPALSSSMPTSRLATPTLVPSSTSAAASPVPTILLLSPPAAEPTVLKLAKQLRNFQGCTHEQHHEADQRHQERHQRPGVHAECSSLARITAILQGDHEGCEPVPDILSSPKLLKRQDFSGPDYQAAFEGTSPTFPEAERLPKSLCLSQHYSASRKGRRPKVTFDIDSVCCFPTSLAVARQGIHWLPKAHASLSLSTDIHFGLRVSSQTEQGVPSQRYVPLYKIPYYYFGTAIGIESLGLFIFFPALYAESQYKHSTYLSLQDQQLWYDRILAPCITKVIGSSNILQHYPATARVASLDSTAVSAESLARKRSAREQLLKYTLQPQHLDVLWACILETVAGNAGFYHFQGATLFIYAKNTKLEHIGTELTSVYNVWEEQWSKVADSQFCNKDQAFVDLAKQTTSPDSTLPGSRVPEHYKAEVFLWKKYCLDAYTKTRTAVHADSTQARGNPRRTTYPLAMMRDTLGQTMFAALRGQESTDGLVYS